MGQRKASSDEFKDLESDCVEVPSDIHRKLRRLIRLLEQERQSEEEEQYFAERLLSVALWHAPWTDRDALVARELQRAEVKEITTDSA